MKQHLRAFAVRADQSGEVDFLASSPNTARDGLEIPASAWRLDAFKKNSVLLWSHDYVNRPPIGKVTEIEATDRGLVASARFDMADPFAAEVARKYADGFLSSFSVGWSTRKQEGTTVLEAELLDISAVNVPSDPAAVAEAVRSYRSLSPAKPLDFSALANLSEAEQEEAIRELHRIIVVEPKRAAAVTAAITEGLEQWRQRQ